MASALEKLDLSGLLGRVNWPQTYAAGRGNVLIEFTDGLRVVTSRWAIRRVKP